jgi:hypothetical protein
MTVHWRDAWHWRHWRLWLGRDMEDRLAGPMFVVWHGQPETMTEQIRLFVAGQSDAAATAPRPPRTVEINKGGR